MINRIAFLITLLCNVATHADVNIKANLSLVHGNHKRDIAFTTTVADKGTFIHTSDDGIVITGTATSTSKDETLVEFRILDAAGDILAEPVLTCAWNTEATWKIGTEHAGKEVESMKLAVVVSRD
jgi:predicted TIM-barrel enzyme